MLKFLPETKWHKLSRWFSRAAWVVFPCILLLSARVSAPQPALPTFQIRSYMGRCLDVGAPPLKVGSPVSIFDCNGTAGQNIGVREFKPPVNEIALAPGGLRPPQDHQVQLHVGNLCIGANSNAPASGAPLELLRCSFSPGQIFVLDGDSIILDSNRDLVVQLQESQTPNGTPLILAHRFLGDAEFWDFMAADGSAAKPTTMFVTVSNASQLQQALQLALPNNVIEVAPGALISFTALPTALPLKTGVTLRGDRRGVSMGPQISLSVDSGVIPVSSFPTAGPFTAFLEAVGTNVRVTGLRIRGPSRDRYGHQHGVAGLLSNLTSDTMRIVVDHNDMSDWTRAAIDLYSFLGEGRVCQQPIVARPRNVLIARNFIHDNRQGDNDQHDSDGYGVVAGWGSNPLIYANEFLMNVHSITADGSTYTGYAAHDNLFLTSNISAYIDMHGSGASHDGGVGGSGVEVLRNTFLGSASPFSMRGYPCSGGVDLFRDNVVLNRIDQAVNWESSGPPPPYIRVDSKFFPLPPGHQSSSLSDPMKRLGVGDFDGDGKDDLFLATGAAWYYAPAGAAEWRFLSAKTETINNLLFGDFDGDGRTDVFTQVGEDWLVSWGGRSPWMLLSNRHGDWNPPGTGNGSHSMFDFHVGDFVGDNRADVFYADGTTWYVSDGGVGPFVPYATSSYRIPDLAFGHFEPNHPFDSKTDVVGVVANQWMAVFALQDHSWKLLRPKLTNSMGGLVVADFDGDGFDDIAEIGTNSQVSRNGTGDWTSLSCDAASPVAIGRFDDTPGADVLVWAGNELQICSSGMGPPKPHSRQDMR